MHFLDLADIGPRTSVRLADGEVDLSGTVGSWSERDRVADAAWAAQGVHKVVNNLQIR